MSILGNWMRKESDKLSTERISTFEGIPVAVNDHFKIFAHAFELNGFKFAKFILIGPLKVNTKEGCNIIIGIDHQELPPIESDSTEIKTDYSITLSKGITEFDFDLEEELHKKINERNITSISISFPHNLIKFPVQDIELLRAALIVPDVIESGQPEIAENTEAEESEEKEGGREGYSF